MLPSPWVIVFAPDYRICPGLLSLLCAIAFALGYCLCPGILPLPWALARPASCDTYAFQDYQLSRTMRDHFQTLRLILMLSDHFLRFRLNAH